MPTRPRRPCPSPGCHALTTGGHCPAHRQATEERRGSSYDRGYNDPRYRAWRADVMRLNGGLCVSCSARGRVTIARVADHIVPRSAGGSQYDLANGQPLCDGTEGGRGCHDIKRAAESRGRQFKVIDGKGLVDVGPLRTTMHA